jgi:branched-chain amino acid transport system substrate-binding protein
MSGRRIVGLSVAVAGALALSACGTSGGSSTGSTSSPFIVMISGGSSAGASTDQLLAGVIAAKAGVQEVNATGGIDGHQVELINSTDDVQPTTALTNLRAQIAKQKPNAYLVATGASISAAVAGALKQNNILFMDSGDAVPTNQPKSNPLAFHVVAPIQVVVSGYVPELKAKGYKRIGILHSDDAYGTPWGQLAGSVFKQAGFDVVGNVQFSSTSLDMTSQLLALRADNPDVIAFDGYGAPVGYVLKGLQTLGWNVPVLGDTAVTATPLVSSDPPSGLVGTSQVKNLLIEVGKSDVYDASATAVNNAVKRLKALGFGKTGASLTLADNYDALLLLQAAGNHAKSIDPQKIAQALEDPAVTQSVPTVVSSGYSYSATSHDPAVPANVYTFVTPGVVVDGQLGVTGG